MRVVSGIAVLFLLVAFVHLMHHYWMNAPNEVRHHAGFLVGYAFGILVGVFSLIGAGLLLRSKT